MVKKSDAEDYLKVIAARHAVFLEGLKTSYSNEFDKFLRAMQKDIIGQLATVEDMTSLKGRKLNALLKTINGAIKEGFAAYHVVWKKQLEELASYEAGFAVRSMGKAVVADLALPTTAQLATAAFASPLSVKGIDGGSLLEPFYRSWTGKTAQRIEGAIRLAAAQGESLPQTMRRIRGTKAANYRDGLLHATKRDVANMTRTAVAHVASQAREATWAANDDIIGGTRFTAVLDGKTSAECRALDGEEFPLGEGPRPPLHINCRSVLTPVLKGDLKLLEGGGQQFSRGADGIKKIDADTTYYGFLKDQPAAFQDEVIGPTRGKLLRDGGLSAERFRALQLDKQFKPRTIAEMRRLEPKAFERIGL